MEENRDGVSVQETTSDRNLRRRARYAQMSPEKRELFLSQLREKRAKSKRQKLFHQSNSIAALTISTSSLSPQQAEASEPTNLPITSTRGQRVVHCLSTFEVGSTSTASHVASKLTSRRTAIQRRLSSIWLFSKLCRHHHQLLLLHWLLIILFQSILHNIVCIGF